MARPPRSASVAAARYPGRVHAAPLRRFVFFCAWVAVAGPGCERPPAATCEEDADCGAGERCGTTGCESTSEPEPVRVLSFTASPTELPAGERATLSWRSAAAVACRIAPAPGDIPRSGTLDVTVNTTTTFTLTCTGAREPASADVTVTALGAVDDAGPQADAGLEADGGPRDEDAGPVPDAGPQADAGPDDAGSVDGGVPLTDPTLDDSARLLTPPLNLTDGSLQSSLVNVFWEARGLTLAADLPCDAHVPRTYDSVQSFLGCVVPAGARVDVLVLYFEPVGAVDTEVATTFVMPTEVAGLAFVDTTLNAGHAAVANADVVYPLDIDGAAGSDRLALADDRRTVSVALTSGSADTVRVIAWAADQPPLRVASRTVVPTDPPEDGDLSDGAIESDTSATLFLEASGVTLAAPLAIDDVPPGVWDTNNATAGATLGVGTTMDVWLVHFDAVDAAAVQSVELTLTFPGRVLGFAGLDETHDAFESDVGSPFTFLANHQTELGLVSADRLELYGDDKSAHATLSVANAGVDDVRFYVEAAP